MLGFLIYQRYRTPMSNLFNNIEMYCNWVNNTRLWFDKLVVDCMEIKFLCRTLLWYSFTLTQYNTIQYNTIQYNTIQLFAQIMHTSLQNEGCFIFTGTPFKTIYYHTPKSPICYLLCIFFLCHWDIDNKILAFSCYIFDKWNKYSFCVFQLRHVAA